jgi:hypothetical protein
MNMQIFDWKRRTHVIKHNERYFFLKMTHLNRNMQENVNGARVRRFCWNYKSPLFCKMWTADCVLNYQLAIIYEMAAIKGIVCNMHSCSRKNTYSIKLLRGAVEHVQYKAAERCCRIRTI